MDQRHPYDVPAERLFELMTDETFLREKYAALGQEAFEVLELSRTDDGATVRTKRVVAANVPGFAKKFISPKNTVLQTERWTLPAGGAPHGTWKVEVEGVPISISGTMSLEADGAGCAHVITGEVSVKIPVVGGKIAKFVEEDSRASVDAEVAFTRSYLARS